MRFKNAQLGINTMQLFRQTLVVFGWLTVITGVAYPLAVTGVSLVLFPHQATGSIILRDGKPIGSELLGQESHDARKFWGRPSATSPAFNGASSGGSNLGPTNPALQERLTARVQELRAAHPTQTGKIPVDLLTTSGSGLDPHISPAAAEYQVERVAQARKLPVEKIRLLVKAHTEGRQLGILGEPRINVVQLNLALEEIK
jgi:K+-transporting ATPase ATPase C chain